MDIIDERGEKNYAQLRDLNIGDLFQLGPCLYMKIDSNRDAFFNDMGTAVNLGEKAGIIDSFSNITVVEKVKVELHIKKWEENG